jgi:2-iminobutanoate/2-iminopropanoate deaminase
MSSASSTGASTQREQETHHDDVVSATAYLANTDDWRAFNAVYREVLSPPYPTRTTVGALLHGFLVDISVIAAVR